MIEPAAPMPLSSASDLARMAILVIDRADIGSDRTAAAALDIAAAALAVHICDWHYMPAKTTPALKEAFGSLYPVWRTLLGLVNGAKHPATPRHKAGIDGASVTYAAWEDDDFWNTGVSPAVQCAHDGKPRFVRALVREFCEAYLADHSSASR